MTSILPAAASRSAAEFAPVDVPRRTIVLTTRRAWAGLGIVCLSLALVAACSAPQAGSVAAPSVVSRHASGPTQAASDDKSEPPTVDGRSAASNAALTEAVTDDGPGCSAAVGQDGSVAWSAAKGAADVIARVPLTTQSRFDIASVGKQFTAMSILLLARKGRISLEDPVAKWLPGMPVWANNVTVSDLVHHTSGIPDYTTVLIGGGTAVDEAADQNDALRAINASQPVPRGRFQYSNSNYVLLAEIVRRVSGELLPQFANRRIFEPLQLGIEINPAPEGDVAVAWDRTAGNEWTRVQSRWTQIGDGATWTTPSELVRWGDNYRTHRVGGRKVADMQLEGAVEIVTSGPRYGAGIVAAPDGSLSHEGGWAGFVTLFGVSADRHTVIAVMCNSPRLDALHIAEALRTAWDGGATAQ